MPVFQNGLIFSMFLIVFVRVEVEGQDYSCVTCDNGGRCLVTSENPTDTTLTYCSSCQCGSSYSGPCCETFVDPCATPNVCDSDHICVSFTDGSHVCDCPAGTTGSDCQNDIDPCESDFCRSGANCTVNDMATNGYVCECPEILLQETSGEFCEDYDGQSASSKCTPTYCSNGGICFENGGSQRSCTCQPLTYGPTCQNTNPCFSAATNPCLNMGVCTATSQTGYECGCQDIWTGSTCADYDACNSASDPCRFGTCESTGNGTFVCNCDPGFTGIYCGTNINECLDANGENPCKFNSTCTDGIAEYNCTCVSGTTGDNCEINIDDCGTQGQKTYCNTVDSGAVCNDLLDGYTCTCSAKYTDYNCSMNIHVWEAIQALGGDGMKLTDLIQLLDEMVDQPSLIKDILPFMLSLMPLENQTQMGFDFKDMFSWLSFEGTELSETDVKQWYEPTLGNCFTFNAPYYSNFSIRRAGIGGGFKALLNVRTDEYLSWIDTEGLNVFIHDPAVSIFTESPRFTAEPGTVTSIFSSKIAYKRLDGNYGDCAWDKSRVGSYYYEGAYTTDGCLRSCYQDKVASSCDCYDPRYPMPDNATICSLEMRDCVLNVTEALPDPSKWADCYCPLPCQEAQYMVNYAAGGFSFRECEIISNEELKSECLTVYNDLVRLEVSFPKLSQRLFLETPKMSMLSFISYAGGLLGCMTGISIISLIEFGYLILRLLYACVNDSGTHIRKIDDLVD